MIQFDLSLYLVTDSSLLRDRTLEQIVIDAVKGGVTMVQLREKNCTSKEFYTMAMSLKKCLSPYNIPLIINDRLDIALACDADGLHLGQSDLPCTIARRILGKDKIIGLSVEKLKDVEEANKLDIDYIGISPIFGTPTKTDTATPIGLSGAAEFIKQSVHPVVCIGGININNAEEVMATGSKGISVVSAIISADNPQEVAYKLREITKKARIYN